MVHSVSITHAAGFGGSSHPCMLELDNNDFLTERYGQVVNTPASYSGGAALKSQPLTGYAD
jgi:hypothetical protein